VLPLDSTHFYTKLNTIYNVFCGIHFHRSHLLALGVAITLDSGESTLKACWLLKYWSVSTLVSSGQSSSIKYIRKFLFTQSHVNSANFVMLNPSIQTMSYLILTKLFNTKDGSDISLFKNYFNTVKKSFLFVAQQNATK